MATSKVVSLDYKKRKIGADLRFRSHNIYVIPVNAGLLAAVVCVATQGNTSTITFYVYIEKEHYYNYETNLQAGMKFPEKPLGGDK